MRKGTDRTKNSLYQKNSRYVQGGVTDMRNKKMLGWWERKLIKPDISDIGTYVFSGEEGRPDLIAFRVYGKANLGWVILQANNIVDINEELQIGMKLIVPTERRLALDILNSSTGGKKK